MPSVSSRAISAIEQGCTGGITILGYVINIVAVPLLALAGRWETAAALIIAGTYGEGHPKSGP
jgi:hypothetical protein